MTDVGFGALAGRARVLLLSRGGLTLLVCAATLLTGLLLGSLVGRIVCGLIFLGALTAYWVTGRKGTSGRGDAGDEEELYSQPPESPMKKLLFDDFQSSGSQYVVREIEAEEQVVPSTKSVQPAPVAPERESRTFTISDFYDQETDGAEQDAEPRREFNFLLRKTLLALQDVLFARRVSFFWANREKRQLILEVSVADGGEISAPQRLPLGDDLLSQVAQTGTPRLVGRVNPAAAADLVPYEGASDRVQSVVAVPVYFRPAAQENLPVGVLVADSAAEDSFGDETYAALGDFAKLISGLIRSYTQKYDLLLESELLASVRRLQERVKSAPQEATVLQALADETSRLVNWDVLTIVMFSEERDGWEVQRVVNRRADSYVTPGADVDVRISLAGEAITANAVQSVDDLTLERRPRFARSEPMAAEGSFVAVPISSLNRCYGALTLESRSTGNFAGIEVDTVYRLVEQAAGLLEVLYLNDILRDMVVVDPATGCATRRHFLTVLEQEVQRAEEVGHDLVYISFALDDAATHQNRYGRDGVDAIIAQVARMIRAHTRPYDTVGLMESDRFGVLLAHTPASDGYLLAERIRKYVAGQVITVRSTSLSVTVSAGVCGHAQGMTGEQLMAGTSAVLHRAMEDGGNLVRVY
jgi:diguanylate cyclase (GGDEF)-like protein